MFKIKVLAIVGGLLLAGTVNAQDRYFTKSAKIHFESKATLEDIEATNKTATAVLDKKTGAFQFSLSMKGFEFAKALMQEHFNENYVESSKYPKSEFKGTVVNNAEVNYSKSGSYPVVVKGKLTIHGVTREVVANGILKVEGDKVHAESTFNIQLADYNIKIPAVVKDKISNNIKIFVDANLDPLKS
jgi:polyisoprenoid-binding protein YceI